MKINALIVSLPDAYTNQKITTMLRKLGLGLLGTGLACSAY